MNSNTRIYPQPAEKTSEPTWLECSLEYAESRWRTIGFRKKPLSVPGRIHSGFDNTIPQNPDKQKVKFQQGIRAGKSRAFMDRESMPSLQGSIHGVPTVDSPECLYKKRLFDNTIPQNPDQKLNHRKNP